MACVGGRVTWTGRTDEVSGAVTAAAPPVVFDAGGSVVTPCFVDSHTHALFHGTREIEFAMRAAGATYQQISAAGGGIASTVQSTRAASPDLIRSNLERHLRAMLRCGTGTVEVKSGYGLDLETEIRCLAILADCASRCRQTLVPTFLGPHAVPAGFPGGAGAYIDFVISDVLPEVARKGLAVFVDIFCEEGAFDLEQSRRFLTAAAALGMGTRIHSDEFTDSGSAALAAELGAASADHLLAAGPSEISALAAGNTVATLLPGTAFNLGLPFPDARRLLDSGAAVALATDFNPGSCYCESMPFIVSTAVCRCGMTVEEALVAATANGAAALGLGDRKGSLQPGADADFTVWALDDYRGIPYHLVLPDIRFVFLSAEAESEPGTGASGVGDG
jgi:imidazolonepropionase